MQTCFKVALGAFIIACSPAIALEKLSDKYLIGFGDPKAPLKVTEYFSFQCPHCIWIFQKDFDKIKRIFIEDERIYWVFHPVPRDLVTVQALHCLSQLNDTQKMIFLEALLDVADGDDPSITSQLMMKAMEVFDKPMPLLQEREFLEETEAFVDAFHFLKQKDQVDAVPTIEVNSQLYPEDVPDFEFIQKIVKGRGVG